MQTVLTVLKDIAPGDWRVIPDPITKAWSVQKRLPTKVYIYRFVPENSNVIYFL